MSTPQGLLVTTAARTALDMAAGLELPEAVMIVDAADGEGKYRDESAFAREKIREGHLRDLGQNVVRWTGHEGFSSPQFVTDRVA